MRDVYRCDTGSHSGACVWFLCQIMRIVLESKFVEVGALMYLHAGDSLSMDERLVLCLVDLRT